MASAAFITIVGNLGGEPEMRYTDAGKAYTTFSVAVNKQGKNRDETQWWRVTYWNTLAEFAANNLQTGSTVIVFGRPTVRLYEKKDGTQGVSAEVAGQELQVVAGRKPLEDVDTSVSEVDSIPF